jgi:hypothetical protein
VPEGDPNVDVAHASAVGCSPTQRSLTPPRPPLSDQRGVLREAAALPRLSGSGHAGRRVSARRDGCLSPEQQCLTGSPKRRESCAFSWDPEASGGFAADHAGYVFE